MPTHLGESAASDGRAVRPPRLLDRVRESCRVRHFSLRTEDTYVGWIRRFILFHVKRHPLEMGAAEVNRFLTSLAVECRVAASTQNQARCSLLFLYQVVLEVNFEKGGDSVVLSRAEVRDILAHLEGSPRLVALLLYGSGLRLLDALRLRGHDLEFDSNEILVRAGKGQKDRITMLPASVKGPLAEHLLRVRDLHQRDLAAGHGSVYLPDALDRKYPRAPTHWGWQYLGAAWGCVQETGPGTPVERGLPVRDRKLQFVH